MTRILQTEIDLNRRWIVYQLNSRGVVAAVGMDDTTVVKAVMATSSTGSPRAALTAAQARDDVSPLSIEKPARNTAPP